MTNSVKNEANVRTGISINRDLAEKADALAQEMGVSRSGLYTMVLREFIRRREGASLLEKLNEAYAEPDPEDERLAGDIKRYSRRLLDEYER
jgi:hypothetical protein